LLRHQLAVLQRSVTRPRVTRFASHPSLSRATRTRLAPSQIPEQTMRKYTVGSHLCDPHSPGDARCGPRLRRQLRSRTIIYDCKCSASSPSSSREPTLISTSEGRASDKLRGACPPSLRSAACLNSRVSDCFAITASSGVLVRDYILDLLARDGIR
jgi:hypothetical protein